MQTDMEMLDGRLLAFLVPVTPPSPGGRVIVAGPDGKLLPAVLDEVAETILPRRLTFTADGGECLTLDVLNRTILQVADGTVGRQSPSAKSLISRPLEQKQTAGIVGVLNAFMAGLTRLTVKSDYLAQPPDPAVTGISVAALRDHCAVPITDRLTRFLAALDDPPQIVLQMEGPDMTYAAGDEHILADMLDVSCAIWGDAPNPSDNAQFIVLESLTDSLDPISTVLARAGDVRLLFQLDHVSAADLAARWLCCG